MPTPTWPLCCESSRRHCSSGSCAAGTTPSAARPSLLRPLRREESHHESPSTHGLQLGFTGTQIDSFSRIYSLCLISAVTMLVPVIANSSCVHSLQPRSIHWRTQSRSRDLLGIGHGWPGPAVRPTVDNWTDRPIRSDGRFKDADQRFGSYRKELSDLKTAAWHEPWRPLAPRAEARTQT
jgi:hypothetical protein